MTDRNLKKEINRQLDSLPIELQRRVLDFIYALSVRMPRGTPGAQLVQFAGIIDKEEALSMMAAIEESCEVVEKDGW